MNISYNMRVVTVYLLFFYISCILCMRMRWFKKYNLSCMYCKKADFKARIRPIPIKSDVISISINTDIMHGIIDKRFLSFSIDTIEMKRKYRCLSIHSRKVNRLARALSPAFIRIGGTPQDFLTYVEENEKISTAGDERFVARLEKLIEREKVNCTPHFQNWKLMRPFNTSKRVLQSIFNFAKRNKLNLIFGLNALKRNADDSWNDENARKIIRFAENNNYKVDWTLGNEPNRYSKYGLNLSPSQHASDFRKLKYSVRDSLVFGPDTSQPTLKQMKYLKSFFDSRPPIDAMTYHQYSMSQITSTLDAYLDPTFMDKLNEQMVWMVNLLNLTKTVSELWLGETGSSSGGGAANLSDTYASGFLYLAKLGLASKNYHKVVIRQSFYGGYYGLLDPITTEPLPDYWSALLFKKLIGTQVLDVYDIVGTHFKAYGYCSKKSPNDIVIMFINFRRNSSVKLSLNTLKDNAIEQYLLTPLLDDLQSKHVLLNGKQLKLHDGYKIPKLRGKLVKQPVVIPKTSYGFLIVNNVNAKACKLAIIP